jgi:hypothetical protein
MEMVHKSTSLSCVIVNSYVPVGGGWGMETLSAENGRHGFFLEIVVANVFCVPFSVISVGSNRNI